MFRLLLAFVVSVGINGPVPAASPDPKSLAIPAEELSKARELVQQLGDERFAEREKAELELAKMGRLARPALVEGANTDDSQEVRARCLALLPRATALDVKARVEVFLADAEGQFEHDLPGWQQFRSVVRNEWHLFGHLVWSDKSLDKPARAVFADLISNPINRSVVMAVAGPQGELGQLTAARRQELYYQKYPRAVVVGGVVVQPNTASRNPTTDDLAALLFAETQVASKFVPRTTAMSTLVSASGYAVASHADEKGKVYKALAAAWLDSRSDPVEMYQAMTIAGNLALQGQRMRLAVRLFTMNGATPSYRGLAATHLIQCKDRSVIPLMEKAMDDATVIAALRRNVIKDGKQEIVSYEVQLRDVALAVALHLTEQKLEDYGYIDRFQTTSSASYSYSRYELPADARKAAIEKWKAWKEKEKK